MLEQRAIFFVPCLVSRVERDVENNYRIRMTNNLGKIVLETGRAALGGSGRGRRWGTGADSIRSTWLITPQRGEMYTMEIKACAVIMGLSISGF